METTSIVYISAEVIVGVLSVFGNCIVIIAIWRNRRLHTITNVFVGNLAIADIVVGLLAAPSAALAYAGLPKNFYGCVFINSVILIVTNISILMLLGVALERFLAIKEPFLYQRSLTVRRAVYINLFIWLIGFLLGMVPMYGWNKGERDLEQCQFTFVITYEYMVYFQFFGLVLLPLFLMMCIYIYILIIVRRHMRQTNALRTMFQHERRVQEGFNKDVKAAKMLALVILFFGIFWLPVNIMNCIALFCSSCTYPPEVLLAAIVMSHANSCINPFLYAASNSRIKRAIKNMFGIKIGPEDLSTDLNHQRITNGVSQGYTPNQPSSRSDQEDNRVVPFTIAQDKFLQLNPKLSTNNIRQEHVQHETEIPGTTSEDTTLTDLTLKVRPSNDVVIRDTQSDQTHSIIQPSTSHTNSDNTLELNISELSSVDSETTYILNNSLIHEPNGDLNIKHKDQVISTADTQNNNNELVSFINNLDLSTTSDTSVQNWCWSSPVTMRSVVKEEITSIDSLLGLESSTTKEISPSHTDHPFTKLQRSISNENHKNKLELHKMNGSILSKDYDTNNGKVKNYNFVLDIDESELLKNKQTEHTKL